MKKLIVLFVCVLSFQAFGQWNGWVSQIQLAQGHILNDIYFFDSNIGWAVGNFGTFGKIFKTTNGGNNWIVQKNDSLKVYSSVFFIDSLNGFVVGNQGSILKTTNGGNQWTKYTNITSSLFSVHFSNGLNGCAVGGGKSIFKTIDGGITWSDKSIGGLSNLYSVQFIDSLNGYTVGDNGTILKTTNGGNTWLAQNTGLVFSINSVCFIDVLNGWVAAGAGIILRTSNGGNNWIIQNVGLPSFLTSVHFTDSQNGWVVGGSTNGGTICKTTDGGTTWINQTNPVSTELSSIYFIDTQNGWIVGDGGTILHTSTGGVTPTHKTIVSSPTFFIYPNPAEESFSLAGKGEILGVSIINAMGKEGQLASEGEVNADNRIDIRGLKPGLYWVKIKTNTGVAVEKLLKK